MTETDTRRDGPAEAGDGAVVLSGAEAKHLRAALQQMELLIHARCLEAGMKNLLAMLRHLQAVGRAFA